MATHGDNAADRYAARVDAVLTQRTRLRGRQPPGDLFAGLPSDHPLMKADPRRPLDPNLEIIASYIQPDDVIIDVGGGAGRISLPLALRCREVINVEPSVAMGAGFRANADQAGISNARLVEADWLTVDPPAGTVALVNHILATDGRPRTPVALCTGNAVRRTLRREPRGFRSAVYHTRS